MVRVEECAGRDLSSLVPRNVLLVDENAALVHQSALFRIVAGEIYAREGGLGSKNGGGAHRADRQSMGPGKGRGTEEEGGGPGASTRRL